jgi:RluA family pseudouridine synthase
MYIISKSFTKEKYVIVYGVNESESGFRLDQFLMDIYTKFSRQFLKKKIERGEVSIKGREAAHRPSTKVNHLDEITFTTLNNGLEDEFWNGKLIDFTYSVDIVYEDENIVAINKPPYMATHPTGKHLFFCATVLLEEKYGHTMHSLHRIDRETSGILLFGKNPQTAKEITPLFEKREVKKCYFFISKKNDPEDKLKKIFSNQKRLGQRDDFVPRIYTHCYDENSTEGKPSYTDFHILFEEKGILLGLAYPRTGRQHQIRAHAADSQTPLLGDKLYSGDPKIFQRFKDNIATKNDHEMMHISRHGLHAIGLSLPYKGTKLNIISSLPEDLANWIDENLTKINSEKLNDILKSKVNF